MVGSGNLASVGRAQILVHSKMPRRPRPPIFTVWTDRLDCYVIEKKGVLNT